MEKSKAGEIKILCIRHSWQESLVADAGTFATFAGLIGLGWLIGSPAMQVVGALMAMFGIVVRLVNSGRKNGKTIGEARAWLDELEENAKKAAEAEARGEIIGIMTGRAFRD